MRPGASRCGPVHRVGPEMSGAAALPGWLPWILTSNVLSHTGPARPWTSTSSAVAGAGLSPSTRGATPGELPPPSSPSLCLALSFPLSLLSLSLSLSLQRAWILGDSDDTIALASLSTRRRGGALSARLEHDGGRHPSPLIAPCPLSQALSSVLTVCETTVRFEAGSCNDERQTAFIYYVTYIYIISDCKPPSGSRLGPVMTTLACVS